MTSMPKINDQMVVRFRRTGRRRASFRPVQGGRARVVLQKFARCSNFGGECTTEHGARGICFDDGICRINPVDDHNL